MNNITLYHKDYCPYCKAAKQLMTSLGLTFNEIEVTDNAAKYAEMVKASGRRTVPQIFVGDTHIGGFDDLQLSIENNTFPLAQIQSA